MNQSYKTKSFHIQDMGLFTTLAKTLAPLVGRVTYSSPWQSGFPMSKDVEVGEGSAEFERVDGIAEIEDETDLFIFPDTYYGKEQIALVEKGKRVWGSRNADELEIYRSDAKPYFDTLGIPQGPYEIITGEDALRKYIKSQGDQKLWVKIDRTRGDMETFPVKGYDVYENKIDDVMSRLGPKAKIMKFTVEQHLEGTLDLAIDTHAVDGQFPSVALLGTEKKGELYACVRKKWSQMPQGLVSIYDALRETLESYEYRNFLSLESRGKGAEFMLGDPCCRNGSPPAELQFEMIKNLPDVMWFGAEGKMIDPDIPSEHGVMLIIHSPWAEKHPLMIDYPDKFRDKIKFRYDSQFDGKTWIMPQDAGPRVAAIVCHGNKSIEDLFEEAKDIARGLNGVGIEDFSDYVPAMMKQIKQFEEWGIKF